jgi:GcrA cell cycle regulator
VKGNHIDWTPELESQLDRLWNVEKLSRAKIAIALGISKNAVIGKANRMGLDPKINAGAFPKTLAKDYVKLDKTPKIGRVGRIGSSLIPELAVFHRSPDRTCQWLEGNPKEFNWCGKPTTRVYCQEHHDRCYVKIVSQKMGDAS